MLEKFMDYAMAKDISIEELIRLHDDYNYAVVVSDGKITDFIYEGQI